MNRFEASSAIKIYYEKMRANYQGTGIAKITPDNVFQEGIRHNYSLFIELVNSLMLPGSGVKHADRLLKIPALIAQNKSVLFLMKHVGNFDVPCFFSLVSREGDQYQNILERLVFIAGRKLNEDSIMVRTFSEIFSRLVIVPNRDIPPKAPNETPKQRCNREAILQEAARINRAALRRMLALKKDGHIIVLFPMGGRPKPWLKENGVKETTSYMRLFDYVYFINMEGNLLPVGTDMTNEHSVKDKIVFTISDPVLSKSYLDESRQLFDKQVEEEDFDQFNVGRVMLEIGQTLSVHT